MSIYAQETAAIPSGGSTSNEVNLALKEKTVVVETAPAFTGTVEMQVDMGHGFMSLYSGGEKVTLAAAGCHVFSPLRAQKFRLVSSASEAEGRTCYVTIMA